VWFLKSIFRKSGISISSHSGRRTFATVKNENDVGMVTIQKLMRHSNIQTTALYCDVSDGQLANAANVFRYAQL
jgi:integrase/recombinase XerD